jgi:hypothetical protein
MMSLSSMSVLRSSLLNSVGHRSVRGMIYAWYYVCGWMITLLFVGFSTTTTVGGASRMKNKVCVVTGAGAGLGLGIASITLSAHL